MRFLSSPNPTALPIFGPDEVPLDEKEKLLDFAAFLRKLQAVGCFLRYRLTHEDREKPHSSPLPNHHSYESVSRCSADRAE